MQFKNSDVGVFSIFLIDIFFARDRTCRGQDKQHYQRRECRKSIGRAACTTLPAQYWFPGPPPAFISCL
ncbi:UNVERIFIED_CONTAM: hypothetical protein Sindi_2855800, partial [Sesamum indicum]